jgi:ribosome-associated toxin RatA of RatAB toxin-antitoxin module
MLKKTLIRNSKLDRDFIFKLSTDVENFSKILPKYFQSLKITASNNSELPVDEKISFLGKTLTVKTKHLIKKPDLHSIHILTGPLRGSSFVERYASKSFGTKIIIDVNLKFNGLGNFFYFLSFFIHKQINKVMDEFVLACESQQDSISSFN